MAYNTQMKPYSGPWRYSWVGLEDKKKEVEDAAREVVRTDAVVRAKYPSSVATGLIMAEIRISSNQESQHIQDEDVCKAAEAHRKLEDIHRHLVWEHHLDFDFVRVVWAPILDPSQEEKDRCRNLLYKLNRKGKRT